MEAHDIKHKKMKVKIKEEFVKRPAKLFKSKLNSGNLFHAINTRAVSLYRYGARMLDWTQGELKQTEEQGS